MRAGPHGLDVTSHHLWTLYVGGTPNDPMKDCLSAPATAFVIHLQYFLPTRTDCYKRE